ncbi:MAG: tRNA (guanosine(37)-N1)-methyltransferase TrmD [Devosiaceae bacterium]|nr:tRNA (guanosine(37)-N1)-methyltransferase TrmD [Devosiaceae bacterium]
MSKAKFHASIISLYPELFPGTLGASVIGRGLKENLWSFDTINLRDFGTGKHKQVDDSPAGGGAGLVLKADVLAKSIDFATPKGDNRKRYLLSPRGKPFTQQLAKNLSQSEGVVLICGRFEGVDQRVIEQRDLEEISIGDYILAGGEVGAMVMLEAITRFIPNVLGSNESIIDESFENGLLEYNQYTRPVEFEGQEIPNILTSGNHKKIKQWRDKQSEALTKLRRPDLIKK